MGRIKNIFIKNLAKSLIEKHPGKFSDDFNKNKEELGKLMKLESKKIRNMVAGYLTHAIRKGGKVPTFEVKYQVKETRQRRGRIRRKRR